MIIFQVIDEQAFFPERLGAFFDLASPLFLDGESGGFFRRRRISFQLLGAAAESDPAAA